jgi:hypothetical protein
MSWRGLEHLMGRGIGDLHEWLSRRPPSEGLLASLGEWDRLHPPSGGVIELIDFQMLYAAGVYDLRDLKRLYSLRIVKPYDLDRLYSAGLIKPRDLKRLYSARVIGPSDVGRARPPELLESLDRSRQQRTHPPRQRPPGRPRGHKGRPPSIHGMSYEQWFERMREARDRFLIRGETPTEAQLMAALGVAT